MINMNIRPPRETADRNVDSVPNVNARIRNSGSRNIGSATRCSMSTNATSDSTAPPSSAITFGEPQPIACEP